MINFDEWSQRILVLKHRDRYFNSYEYHKFTQVGRHIDFDR